MSAVWEGATVIYFLHWTSYLSFFLFLFSYLPSYFLGKLDTMATLTSEETLTTAALLTSEPLMDYASTQVTTTVNPIAIHSAMMEASTAADTSMAITAPVVPSMSSAIVQSTGYDPTLHSPTGMMYNPIQQHHINSAAMAAVAAAAVAVQQPIYTPVIASDNQHYSHLHQVAGQQHQQAEEVLATSSQIQMDPMTSMQEPDIIQAHATLAEAANVLQHRQQVLQDCVHAAVNNAVPDQYVSSCMAEHQQRMNQAMAANNALMSLLEQKRNHHEAMVRATQLQH
jgi:hypothetical protein